MGVDDGAVLVDGGGWGRTGGVGGGAGLVGDGGWGLGRECCVPVGHATHPTNMTRSRSDCLVGQGENQEL